MRGGCEDSLLVTWLEHTTLLPSCALCPLLQIQRSRGVLVLPGLGGAFPLLPPSLTVHRAKDLPFVVLWVGVVNGQPS
jgi:hypothetical protein